MRVYLFLSIVILLGLGGEAPGSEVPSDTVKPGSIQNSGVKDHLHDVTFVNNQLGWAVGDANTILHTSDGWQVVEPTTRAQ